LKELIGVLKYLEIPFKEETEHTFHQPRNYIDIKGTEDVFKFLDAILEKYETFAKITRYIPSNTHISKDELINDLHRWVIQAVEQQTVAKQNIFANALLMKLLNRAFEKLKTELESMELSTSNDKIDTNLSIIHYLSHPFYQLLVFGYKACVGKIQKYDNLPMYQRLVTTTPTQESIETIGKKYLSLIPKDYINEQSHSKTLNFEKLKKYIEQLSINQQMLSSSLIINNK
jgi:hypothetical protein